MKSQLIIIRGNSGSGKTTVSKILRNTLGPKTMLLQQDMIRRDILKVEDKIGNPAIGLIEQMATYGLNSRYTVRIEGILNKEKYGDMLEDTATRFDVVHVYYFDIPFEETVKRHHTKINAHEFGENELRNWWKEKDYLGLPSEKILDERMSVNDIVKLIVEDINLA